MNSGARERIFARMPAPAGGTAPDSRLPFTATSREALLAQFVTELEALGAHVLVARQPAAAREYLERLAAEKGGEVVCAHRPAVEALVLTAARFHSQSDFPARDAVISVSQADYALADTGTLVLFSEEGEGRTLSLVAPVNVTVVPFSRLLSGLPELLAREPELAARSSAMILVTGPSRTADIELTLTVGVHGPGELHVITLADR